MPYLPGWQPRTTGATRRPGRPRRGLMEFIALAPADEEEPPGMLLDRVRLLSSEH